MKYIISYLVIPEIYLSFKNYVNILNIFNFKYLIIGQIKYIFEKSTIIKNKLKSLGQSIITLFGNNSNNSNNSKNPKKKGNKKHLTIFSRIKNLIFANKILKLRSLIFIIIFLFVVTFFICSYIDYLVYIKFNIFFSFLPLDGILWDNKENVYKYVEYFDPFDGYINILDINSNFNNINRFSIGNIIFNSIFSSICSLFPVLYHIYFINDSDVIDQFNFKKSDSIDTLSHKKQPTEYTGVNDSGSSERWDSTIEQIDNILDLNPFDDVSWINEVLDNDIETEKKEAETKKQEEKIETSFYSGSSENDNISDDGNGYKADDERDSSFSDNSDSKSDDSESDTKRRESEYPFIKDKGKDKE